MMHEVYDWFDETQIETMYTPFIIAEIPTSQLKLNTPQKM